MSKKQVLDLETEGKVGSELLKIQALGDAIAAIGIAGGMFPILDGTLTNLGYEIVEKTHQAGKALGIM